MNNTAREDASYMDVHEIPKKYGSFYVPPEQLVPMVVRLQQGETKVEDEIYKVFHKQVYGHIFRKISNHDETERLVKVVFNEIQENIGTLRNPAAFVGWCKRIVINKSNDYLREKYRKENKIRRESKKRSSAKYVVRRLTQEEKELLNSKLEEIPQKQARVMQLHYIDEMPLEAIAQELNIPLGTVKSRLHYGRLAFRQLVRPENNKE